MNIHSVSISLQKNLNKRTNNPSWLCGRGCSLETWNILAKPNHAWKSQSATPMALSQ